LSGAVAKEVFHLDSASIQGSNLVSLVSRTVPLLRRTIIHA
jgi:hypothetical protein